MFATGGGTAIGHYQAAPAARAARLPVLLPPRPAPLAGREELLARLHTMLTGTEQPRMVVLCGMGGVGKTSLATEYAHRHLVEVGVAWRVRAEEPEVAAADLAELAAQLGGREIADPRDPVASAHAVLAAYPASWLIIFDNAPDQIMVRRLLPPAGNGRVVITSQSQHWPGGKVLEVPVLDPASAAQFLISRTGDPDQGSAARLAGELGGLPLALEQAGAYIQASGTTLAAYLDMFSQRRAELLARGEAADHPESVIATLTLALARLEGEWPVAAGLLRLLACVAPEPVPLGLLLASPLEPGTTSDEQTAVTSALQRDPIATADAIGALRRYSLVSPAGNGMVLVHRLVSAITMDQTPADQVACWRQVAVELIDHAIPTDVSVPAAWPVCAVLLPHAQAVLGLTSPGIWRIARYLGESGNYPAAKEMFRHIADSSVRAEGYGVEHPDTLLARANLADWTGLAGDAAAARDMFAALVPVREKVSGAEHPDTLTARANLASWTGRAGDAMAARDLYASVMPVREKVSGAEHPDTLTARANQARWTGMAGNAMAARDLYVALVPVREKVSGAEHPLTLIDRANLAYWTGDTGDAVAARDMFAALVPVREKVSGAEHPDTLLARANLARFTGEAGDAAGARDLYAALVPVREKVSGAEHPDTLTARANLAHWTKRLQRT